MSEIFISYARATEPVARRIAEALRALGYGVWRDDELPAHRAYAEVIEERLAAARAVVVIWSADAARSEWVQSEADRARAARKLVQLRVDDAPLPMPFDRIQCADLTGWAGEPDAPAWKKVLGSIAALTQPGDAAPAPPAAVAGAAPARRPHRASICVLPFANLSGDPEQEYFSDGITEDITTDLSKISALFVVARNTAFTFKGRNVNVPEVAARLGVGHVLEGSVRKAGHRVRITAQLIDGGTGGHLWAERWDRDLTDIFALQDEISQAIVAALKLRLLPKEKAAIGRRGTQSVEAYELYLMARRQRVLGSQDDAVFESIVRLCRAATEADPNYADAWALMGFALANLSGLDGARDAEWTAAIDRALALDPKLAGAWATRGMVLSWRRRSAEADAAFETALRLDPASHDANLAAAQHRYRNEQFAEAARLFETAAALDETDFAASLMAMSSHQAGGETGPARAAAQETLARAEAAIDRDASNGLARSAVALALAVLGEKEKARAAVRSALAADPDNPITRYNLACALSRDLLDADGAVELIGEALDSMSAVMLVQLRIDPDFAPIRDDPRFQALVAAADARLAAARS